MSNSHHRSAAGPQNYNGFEHVAAVHFLVHFDGLIHENQSLATGTNSAPYHYEVGIPAVFEEGRRARGLCEPTSIVRVIVSLLDSKQFLVTEENAFPVQRCVSAKELFASFESHEFIVIAEKLIFGVWLEVEASFWLYCELICR